METYNSIIEFMQNNRILLSVIGFGIGIGFFIGLIIISYFITSDHLISKYLFLIIGIIGILLSLYFIYVLQLFSFKYIFFIILIAFSIGIGAFFLIIGLIVNALSKI